MSWVEAVKEYAKLNGGQFVIPKRDSDAYKKVKEIQEAMQKKAAAPMAAAAPAKKVRVVPPKTANVVPEVKEEVKVARAKKAPKAEPVAEKIANVVEKKEEKKVSKAKKAVAQMTEKPVTVEFN